MKCQCYQDSSSYQNENKPLQINALQKQAGRTDLLREQSTVMCITNENYLFLFDVNNIADKPLKSHTYFTVISSHSPITLTTSKKYQQSDIFTSWLKFSEFNCYSFKQQPTAKFRRINLDGIWSDYSSSFVATNLSQIMCYFFYWASFIYTKQNHMSLF